ncbi:RHS repeat domain-containing protein, partial [Methylobacter sp.]|uniref:RHS repeat domain-containing protein n=1 Tax=Methylobacter sp. TaxID=2051955 RepID=UPI002582F688
MLRETALPGLDNTVSEFSYDPLGCLTRAHNSHAQLRFQYNPLGQVISESQDGAAVTHEYDALGRLTQHQAGLRGKAALLGRRYGYDVTGKLNAVDDLRQGASRY